MSKDYVARFDALEDCTVPWGPADIATEIMHRVTRKIHRLRAFKPGLIWVDDEFWAKDASQFTRLPLSHQVTEDMRRVMVLLLSLNEDQRGRVLCWFCDGCRRYVGPGDSCTCKADE